jgi:UDP-hydrolysing UDP-N-acetyl-D-glucosamine 2-epimerase
MEGIRSSAELDFRLIVTGTHLSEEFGFTKDEVEADGFLADELVDMQLPAKTPSDIGYSMGVCASGMARALERIKPDYLVVLGDRYELLPICSVSLVMRIPVIHISGGDITEGAIDNEVRNAVSMLSEYHFPGAAEAGDRLIKLGIRQDKVFIVGEPGLDNFRKLSAVSRDELAKDLQLDSGRSWVLFTYHPETKRKMEENIETARYLMQALLSIGNVQVIATYSNADIGGMQINGFLEKIAAENKNNLKLVKSLGQRRYISLMKECSLMAGNSSSGIVEAPLLGIPVINIGDRQAGRHMCANIWNCRSDKTSIDEVVKIVARAGFKLFDSDDYFGDGYSADRIVGYIKEICVRNHREYA